MTETLQIKEGSVVVTSNGTKGTAVHISGRDVWVLDINGIITVEVLHSLYLEQLEEK